MYAPHHSGVIHTMPAVFLCICDMAKENYPVNKIYELVQNITADGMIGEMEMDSVPASFNKFVDPLHLEIHFNTRNSRRVIFIF